MKSTSSWSHMSLAVLCFSITGLVANVEQFCSLNSVDPDNAYCNAFKMLPTGLICAFLGLNGIVHFIQGIFPGVEQESETSQHENNHSRNNLKFFDSYPVNLSTLQQKYLDLLEKIDKLNLSEMEVRALRKGFQKEYSEISKNPNSIKKCLNILAYLERVEEKIDSKFNYPKYGF